MSEVHRYQAVQIVTELGNKLSYSPAGPWVVMATEFDSMKTCFDAQRLRADTAEAERDALRYKAELYDEVWADATRRGYANVTMALCALAAAEQRIAELKEAAQDLINTLYCESSEGAEAIERYRAALNPKTEAESHQVAREALKMENQRLTPARFKCLACGDYHEGSGDLPCPKMMPYAGSKP